MRWCNSHRASRLVAGSLALLSACAAPEQTGGLDPEPILQQVQVTPASATLGIGDSASFNATGVFSDGKSHPLTLTWASTGGTVSDQGVYHAGGAAGSFLVIAVTSDFLHADTAHVTIADSGSAPVVTGLTVVPGSVTLAPGAGASFAATASYAGGGTSTVTAAWTATGGNVSGGGQYTAGSTPGAYRVVAAYQGFLDTAQVAVVDSTTPPPSLSSLTVLPAAVTLNPGQGAAFTATGHYSDGSSAGVTPAWSATGGTVSAGGQYTAGPTGGSFRVIASLLGKADTSVVTINDTTTPAPTLTAVTVTPASVTLDPGQGAAFSATGHYSDGSSAGITPAWSATGGSISGGGSYLAGATAGNFRVVAALAGHADTALVSINDTTTPPTGGTVLFTEGFDNASIGGRGWYDNTSPAIATTGQHGGAGALQMAFTSGAITPVKGAAIRHKFTGTDRLYVRYWLKYSSSFVGSGTGSHPHEFHILTNLDGDYVGPSTTHLSISFEHHWSGSGGVPRLGTSDALNIDQARANQDLTNVTEARATSGCNGNGDPYPTGCYQAGGSWNNEKIWNASAATFTNAAGSGDKTQWHMVEVYFQLNTIAGGKGVADGIARYWFDGQLVMDKQQVLFRTGQNPNMQFTQLMIAPYIGNGSPVAQTLWIDDLTVATGPVP